MTVRLRLWPGLQRVGRKICGALHSHPHFREEVLILRAMRALEVQSPNQSPNGTINSEGIEERDICVAQNSYTSRSRGNNG